MNHPPGSPQSRRGQHAEQAAEFVLARKPDITARMRGMYGHAVNPTTGKPYRNGWPERGAHNLTSR